MKSTLHPHQVKAMADLRSSLLAGKRRPLIQAPTGAGKTILAAAVVEGALAKGNRVVFVVPALSLIDQTVGAFFREGITDIGVIQADHPMTNWSRPCQIASVQTLQRRRHPDADVVVIDEAHRMFKTLGGWMADPEWAKVPFIGLSATPWTKGLGQYFDDLVIASTTRELIDQGYLSQFRVFAPAHPDLTGVRILAGDFHEADLSKAMDKPELVADVVETWLRLGDDRPTLVFAVDRAHAKKLAERFETAGVSAAYQDAYTDSDERKRIAEKFRSGEVSVVCNVGTLTTGVDWDVRCIVLARPTRSEMLFVQIVGRGLRTAPGKDHCLILDHADNHLRLGFVTDIHHPRLDGGKPNAKVAQERAAPLPKECPKCSFLKPAGVQICPACSFKAEVRSHLEEIEGELVELRPSKSKPAATRAECQRWFSGFVAIGLQRAYQPGWARNQYRQKFGAWPRGLSELPAAEPGQDVLNYVKASLIRFAKSKEARRVG
jgi:superfamily II DNA or RNA helicase